MHTADKLDQLADAMQTAIDHASRPMTQNPTPKRNREYASRLHDAGNLERTQRAMRALAAAHRAGTVPAMLAGLKTKAEIAPLVRKSIVSHGYYHVATDPNYADESPMAVALQQLMEEGTPKHLAERLAAEEAEREIDRTKRDLLLSKIPGYFPTPAEIAAQVVDLADIRQEHRVLEPSAGTGALIDAIRVRCPFCTIYAIEINATMVGVLRSAAFVPGSADHHIAIQNRDFLETNGDLGRFDRIVMNPPFDRGSDIAHIRHAMTLLKPGGRIVAICANGPKQRESLQPIASQWIDLPPGTFKESGTGVASAIVVFEN